MQTFIKIKIIRLDKFFIIYIYIIYILYIYKKYIYIHNIYIYMNDFESLFKFFIRSTYISFSIF